MPLYYHIIPIDKYLWLVWPPNNICLPTSSGYNDFTSRRHHNDGNWIGGIVPKLRNCWDWWMIVTCPYGWCGIREKTGEWYTMTRVGAGLGCAARCEHHVYSLEPPASRCLHHGFATQQRAFGYLKSLSSRFMYWHVWHSLSYSDILYELCMCAHNI